MINHRVSYIFTVALGLKKALPPTQCCGVCPKNLSFFVVSRVIGEIEKPSMTTFGKWRLSKVVPLKCSGSWSAGLAAAAMRGTGGHPLLPGLAEVEGCRGPERLLFQSCVSIELFDFRQTGCNA